MIKKLITNNVVYNGYVIGDSPIKISTYTKTIHFLGIKVMDYTYNCNESLDESEDDKKKKKIGFEKSNK